MFSFDAHNTVVAYFIIDNCLRQKLGFLFWPETDIENKTSHSFRLDTETNRNHQVFQAIAWVLSCLY